MKSGIYKIICIENGRFYIGSSKDLHKRWVRHLNDLRTNKHGNSHLQRSFDKYGEDKFIFEIIEECDSGDLFIREQFYLDTLNPYDEIGFNIGKSASGGDNLTGHPNREEIIEKIRSTVLSGLDAMGESGRKLRWGRVGESNYNYGNRWTSENKRRASEFMKKLYECGNGSLSNRRGKTNREIYGDEVADQISKKISFHASQRIGNRNPFYNKKHSDETKDILRKLNMGKKPSNRIQLVIDGVVYDSYHDASKELNIPVVTIRWRCLSKNPKFDGYQLI